jgi:hypothetical protein
MNTIKSRGVFTNAIRRLQDGFVVLIRQWCPQDRTSGKVDQQVQMQCEVHYITLDLPSKIVVFSILKSSINIVSE